jgi:hypothetical protein
VIFPSKNGKIDDEGNNYNNNNNDYDESTHRHWSSPIQSAIPSSLQPGSVFSYRKKLQEKEDEKAEGGDDEDELEMAFRGGKRPSLRK